MWVEGKECRLVPDSSGEKKKNAKTVSGKQTGAVFFRTSAYKRPCADEWSVAPMGSMSQKKGRHYRRWRAEGCWGQKKRLRGLGTTMVKEGGEREAGTTVKSGKVESRPDLLARRH